MRRYGCAERKKEEIMTEKLYFRMPRTLKWVELDCDVSRWHNTRR